MPTPPTTTRCRRPTGGSAAQAGDDHGDEDPEQHGSRDPEDPESSEYSDPEAPENDKIMQDLDKDHDGKISHQELLARLEWVRQKECVCTLQLIHAPRGLYNTYHQVRGGVAKARRR